MLGFIEVVPLALTGIDFIWFIIGLAGFVVLAAGWSIYSPMFDVLSNISIFGIKPFGFITKLLQASMQKLAQVLMTRLAPLGHWLWALAQMVWRPLYVTLEALGGLVTQITGISQGSQSGLEQLRAKENSDIAALRAQENADIAGVYSTIQGDKTSLEGAINTVAQDAQANLVNAEGTLNARITGNVATLNTRITGVDGALRTLVAGDIATVNTRINTVNHDLVTALNNDVASLEQRITNGVTTSESFATGLVGGLGVGNILKTVTALQSDLNAVKTDITECLDPLCNTVTPQAPRAGRNLNWLKNLESLGFEAAIVALAAECMTNPAAVANDIHTVVTDIGNPLMTGFRDLIGA